MPGFFKNAAVNMATRVAGMAANSLALIVIARSLGPEQQGQFASASLLPVIISAFCGFAFNNATVRLLGQKQFPADVAFGQNIAFGLFSSALGVVAGVIVIFFFGERLFPHNDSVTLLLALAALPSILFINLLTHVLLGMGELTKFSVSGVLASLFLPPALFLLYLVSPELVTVKSVLIVQLLLGAAAVSVTAYWCLKHVRGFKVSFNRNYQSAALKFGLVVYASSLISILDDRIGLFIVNLFLLPGEMGQYSVSVRLAEGLWLISVAMANIVFPRSASSDNESETVKFSCLVCRASFLLTFLLAAVLWLTAPLLISALFSSAYIPAVAPFRILLPGVVAISVWRILANDLIGRGHPLPITVIAVISFFANMAAGFVLVSRFGLNGVAWSVTLVYWLRFVLTAVFYCRKTGVPFNQLWLPTPSDLEIYLGVLGKTVKMWKISKAEKVASDVR